MKTWMFLTFLCFVAALTLPVPLAWFAFLLMIPVGLRTFHLQMVYGRLDRDSSWR